MVINEMKNNERLHKTRFLSVMKFIGLSLVAWVAGTALSVQAAVSTSVGLKARILNPPNAITDLSAAGVGSSAGDIQLAWTAPSNDNGASISHYFIRYATYPAPGVGAAEIWWTTQVASQRQVSPAFSPGTQEFTVLPGFSVGTTYYFVIKSVDVDGSVSPVDARAGTGSQANSLPLASGGSAPLTPANFAGAALSTGSIQWTWDASVGASFYELSVFPSGTFVAQTTATAIIEGSLTPNSQASRRIRAVNGSGISNYSGAQTIFTLASVPISLSATAVNFTEITLAWNANSNPAGTQYRVERSLDNVSYLPVMFVTSTTIVDSGLTEDTTYFYRIRAQNGDGVLTAPSVAMSTTTPLQIDFIAPAAPLGLKSAVDSAQTAVTITWDAVNVNEDGTPITDLVGYNIYRRNSLTGTNTKLTPTPISATAFADSIGGQTFYYSVTAVDTSGNESGTVFFADSSIFANVIYLASDGKSAIIMPESINDALRGAFNKYGQPIRMVLIEEPIPDDTQIIRGVDIKLYLEHTNEEIKDFAFDQPIATVLVGYNTVGGQVTIGAPQAAGLGSSAVTNATPEQLSLYWNNGVSWIKIGGTLDKIEEVLKTNTAFVGRYQLRAQSSATSLNLSKANVYPRTFTPNGDGLNERVYFILENPNNVEVTGEIFDRAGRKVADLPPSTLTTGIATTLIWDGRDNSGSVVPSGAYIYRIKGEGKTFTGSVVVAR